MDLPATDDTAMRVLVVDDSEDERMLTGEQLTAFGVQHGWATDARDALEQLEQHDWDVMVTDVELPGCDGVELTQRARERHPQLRTIFLTGHDEAVVRSRGGEGPVLPKPFTEAQWAEAVARSDRTGDIPKTNQPE